MKNIRTPAVAGAFYPGDGDSLIGEVEQRLCAHENPLKACVAISPHAGYVYSGAVAGNVFSQVQVPNRVVVLGPKHRRYGAAAAVAGPGVWRFPFGDVPIDEKLCEALVNEAPVELDDLAHRDEHSLEVQIPFLWSRNKNIRITPVALAFINPEQIKKIGVALAKVIKAQDEPVLIVASTDMSHFVSQDEAKRLDNLAIEKILKLDPNGLLETVIKNDISMCGVIPTTVALHAATALGAGESRLVQYATSGDVSGDYSSVVGYAGFIVS